MSDVTFPGIDFSKIDLSKAVTELNDALKEGAYVAVGLGVLGFQRAQVQRVELTKQLEAQWEQLGDLPTTAVTQFEGLTQAARTQAETVRSQLAEFAKTFDERVQPVRKQLDEQIERLEQYLPAGTRNVVQSVRAAAASPEQLLRTAVGLD
jgi:uncharacterized protein HemX